MSAKFSASSINFNIVYDDFSEMESKSNGTNADLEKSGQSRNPSETLWYHRVWKYKNKRLYAIKRPQKVHTQSHRKEESSQVLVFSMANSVYLSTGTR